MGKDPAFLFYSSDFLTGTMLFSDEQVGKYIRLLCIQHQNGRLQEKHMLSVCKTYDEDIFSKFIKDENGLYYNRRLETETLKRNSYSESRRVNASKAKSGKKTDDKDKAYANTYEKHMLTHMENENDNENDNDIENDNEAVKDYERMSKLSHEGKSGESLVVKTATGNSEEHSHSKTRKPHEKKKTSTLTKDQQEKFNIFWQAYPSQKSRGRAELSFAKLNPDDKLLKEILDGIARAKKYDHRFKEIRFIPYPSSWLDSTGWEDKFNEGGAACGEHRQHIENSYGRGEQKHDPYQNIESIKL